MAASKFTPSFWSELRECWEGDSREGFKWLVDEKKLDISAPGVRKRALLEGWEKIRMEVSELETRETKKPRNHPEKPSRETKKPSRETTRKTNSSNELAGECGFSGEEIEVEECPSKEQETLLEADPDRFGMAGLTSKEEAFVREYMVDWNATQAAIRAGYSPKSAAQAGCAMLIKPNVQQAVHGLASARARRMGIDADDLMRLWAAIVSFDANELVQLRRVCCAYCYADDGNQPLLSPSGLEQAKRKHDAERAKRLRANEDDDIGEYPEYAGPWLDKRLPPVDGCPECGGDGREEVFFSDTRNLSPAALQVYSGIKVGERGIEMLMMSKEKAMDNLARALGLFRERDQEGSGSVSVSGEELCKLFDDRMRAARDRQAVVNAERLALGGG